MSLSSCANRAHVKVPSNITHGERFSYLQDKEGRFYILTTTPKDLDAAMKTIRPGPASVDKLDLWVITPLAKTQEVKR